MYLNTNNNHCIFREYVSKLVELNCNMKHIVIGLSMKMKKMLTMLVSVMMIMCLWNMTANAEDGGINYAPYYDAETETVTLTGISSSARA